MKLTRFRIKYLLVYLGLFIYSFSFGQGGYLPIPEIGQEDTQWCWAASMNMIINFHNDGFNVPTQCDLAKRYHEIKNTTRNSHNPSFTYPVDCCPPCNGNGGCNSTIQFSKRNSYINHSYFDLLFSYFGFTSVEDVETPDMGWNEIVQEIESCRPFIILLQKYFIEDSFVGPPDTVTYNHAVVAKGFFNDNVNNKWIIINDPETAMSGCQGEQILLPITIMTDPITAPSGIPHYNTAFSMVRFIHSKSQNICNSCCCNELLPASTNSLVALFNNLKIAPIINENRFSLEEIKSKINNNFYTADFIISNFIGKNLESLKILVIKSDKGEIMLTLEQVDEKLWTVREVGKNTNNLYPEQIKVSIPGRSLLKKKLSAQKKEFEIVKYLPGFYLFYRYQYKGKIYVTPAKNYDGIAKKGKTYLEAKILSIIKEKHNIK